MRGRIFFLVMTRVNFFFHILILLVLTNSCIDIEVFIIWGIFLN